MRSAAAGIAALVFAVSPATAAAQSKLRPISSSVGRSGAQHFADHVERQLPDIASNALFGCHRQNAKQYVCEVEYDYNDGSTCTAHITVSRDSVYIHEKQSAVSCQPAATPPAPPPYVSPPVAVPPPAPAPALGFCDTHACIPNFANGTGYIVQCADGLYSQSGGRPGACSGHGGEL